VRALAHSESLSPAGASGYIFRIAVNRWRDRGRRLVSHGNCLPWDEQSALGVSDGFSPERLLGAQQELHHVLGAVEQLGPRTRDVLVRCRLDQMKHAEIARELGISVSAVEKHLVRAMAQLARFNGGTEAPAPRPRDHRGCLGGATTAGDQASKTNQPALRISAGDA
jgi:RNA polymerase sigma-70 factor (ECF subfamily)